MELHKYKLNVSFSITSQSETVFRAGKYFLVELMPGLIPFQLIIHMNV